MIAFMDAESYLYWLKRTDLETARISDLTEAVEGVVAALRAEVKEAPESHAADMLSSLESILEQLHQGNLPIRALQDFRVEFDNDPETYEAPEQVLEEELREIAAGIGKERWCTESYEKLESAVNTFLDGGEENDFWDVVDGLASSIVAAHSEYCKTQILPKEVTLESRVVHKLLCEGIEDWKAALDSLREDEEPDWEWLMQTTEHGNRLLVAVQIFEERVRNALS
mgnify:CR=1 FL=1